tara:strand:- start:15407 stop:16243 length:837 start_codon:yes stop_codon:yes gene_type:complete
MQKVEMRSSLDMIAGAQEIRSITDSGVVFSICTLVNDVQSYRNMLNSFLEAGFGYADCEYIYIDNASSTTYDAYEGLNKAISKSRGKFIILCHQDVLLRFDNRADLTQRLNEIEKNMPNWAVAGNAGGGQLLGNLCIRITDPHGQDVAQGDFPQQVSSLDENFIVLKKSANLGFSNDLSGFHLYGTDICLIAHTRGYECCVIDFHLEHLSPGTCDASFIDSRRRLIDKYRRAFAGRTIQTTCTRFYLSGSWVLSRLVNATPVLKLIRKLQRVRRGIHL